LWTFDAGWEDAVVITFAKRWLAMLQRRRFESVEIRISDVTKRTLAVFAYEQADLLRDRQVTKEEALAAIAERFPELTARQVSQGLARGLFESR
jgi:hypothetical protein